MQQQDPAIEERHKKIAVLQREIVMTESDLKKILNEKLVIEGEERRARKEMERLRMDAEEKQKKKHLLDQAASVKAEQIRHLKKQLNSL